MKTKARSFVLAISLLVVVTANAQVTIGSDSKPSKAALLDVKTQDNAAGGVTSTQGGILFPRVALTELSSLKPFLADGGSATDKLTNKGLIVYNLTTISPFTEGLYLWNGVQWQRVDSKEPTSGYLFLQKNAINNGLGSPFKYMDAEVIWTKTLGGATPQAIEIKEDGTYIFNVRAYTRFCNPATGLMHYFSNEARFGSFMSLAVDGVVVDISIVYANNTFYMANYWDSGTNTLVSFMVPNIKKGSTVKIYWNNQVANLDSANPSIPIGVGLTRSLGTSDTTTLSYWKL